MPLVGKPLGRFVFSKDQPAKVGLSIQQRESAKGRYDALEWNFQLSKHAEAVRNAKPRVDCRQPIAALEEWKNRRARAMTYQAAQKQQTIDCENKRLAKQLSAVRNSPSTVHISPQVHTQLRCYPKLSPAVRQAKQTGTSQNNQSTRPLNCSRQFNSPSTEKVHSNSAGHQQHAVKPPRSVAKPQQQLPSTVAPSKGRLYSQRIPPRPTQQHTTTK